MPASRTKSHYSPTALRPARSVRQLHRKRRSSMVNRLHLAFLILTAAGCGSSPASAPEAPESGVLPRGEALAMAVVGVWNGSAEDGTPTAEGVELTLNADGKFALSAGLVNESYHWTVRDDLVVLLPDLAAEASDGICFRASRITARRIEGKWAYTQAGARVDGDIACRDSWFPVTLERR